MNNYGYNINEVSSIVLSVINEVKGNQSNWNELVKVLQCEINSVEFVQFIKQQIDFNKIDNIDLDMLEYVIDNNCYFVIGNVAKSSFLDSFIKLVLSNINDVSLKYKALYLLNKWSHKYKENYRGVHPYPEIIKYKNILQMKGFSFSEETSNVNNSKVFDINAIDNEPYIPNNNNNNEIRKRIIDDWIELINGVNYIIDNNIDNKKDLENMVRKMNKDKPFIQTYIKNAYSDKQSFDMFLCLEHDVNLTLTRYDEYIRTGKPLTPFQSSLYSQHNQNLNYSPPPPPSQNTFQSTIHNVGNRLNSNLSHIGNSLSNRISSAYGFFKNKIHSSSTNTNN